MTDLITEARELCEKWSLSDYAVFECEDCIANMVIYKVVELCDALEKAERESGCEWCKALSFNPDVGGCQLAFFRSKAHPDGAYAISVSVFDEYGEEQEPVLVQIDNCIRCGKRLEVKHI